MVEWNNSQGWLKGNFSQSSSECVSEQALRHTHTHIYHYFEDSPPPPTWWLFLSAGKWEISFLAMCCFLVWERSNCFPSWGKGNGVSITSAPPVSFWMLLSIPFLPFLPPLFFLSLSSLSPPHLLPISSWHLLSTSLIILFFKCLIKTPLFSFLLSISVCFLHRISPLTLTNTHNGLIKRFFLKGKKKRSLLKVVVAAHDPKDYLTFNYSLRAVRRATMEKHAHMHVNAPAHWYRHWADLHKVNTVVWTGICPAVDSRRLLVFLSRLSNMHPAMFWKYYLLLLRIWPQTDLLAANLSGCFSCSLNATQGHHAYGGRRSPKGCSD